MPKITNAPKHIQHRSHKPAEVEAKPKKQEAEKPSESYPRNESLSKTRAMRDGIDYGSWRKDEIENDYDEKHGKGWGKGGKKEVKEALEAELQRLIQEQLAQAEARAAEAAKAEIKLAEIKQEQIQDTREKEELKDFDEKAYQIKREIKKDDLEAETVKQNAPKEVKRSHNETIAETFQISIPKDEHAIPSISSILLEKDIETEVTDKKPNK